MSNGADIVAVLFLITLGLLGYFTGAIISLLYVVGGFAGVFIARECAAASPAVSFFWWYLAIAVALIALSLALRWVAHKLLLGFFDRASGFCIGMAIGVVVLCLALDPVTEGASKAVQKQIKASYVATRLVPTLRRRLPKLASFSFDQFWSFATTPARH